jgi:uncharacterized peroxidase-related enzyme
MSRIAIPSLETVPAASRPLVDAVIKQLGTAPNLIRLLATSPAALEGWLGLSGALGKDSLDVQTRARIAMLVAELNRCDYCLSAHTYLGKNLAKLDDAELTANRDAASSNPKSVAALQFARAVVTERGHVSPAELEAVRAAGYTDAQVIEIVLHVVMSILTNYVNSVVATDIDFPVVTHGTR